MALSRPPRPLGYPPTPSAAAGFPSIPSGTPKKSSSTTWPSQAPLPPTRPMTPAEPEQGLLWSTIKRQLYKSEVSHMKRLVGESLINENRLLRDELSSLRQILMDFERQNDELSDSLKKQVLICGSQHRNLLKRQAKIILEDMRSQAECYGHTLEDIVPELRDVQLREFICGSPGSVPSLHASCGWVQDADVTKGSSQFERRGVTPPVTPSTRPSSSSGCSSTPDVFSVHSMPLGRPLGLEELGVVAEGIREALEAEHAALLSSIGEQMANLEAEEARRAESVGKACRGEPSTAELQKFLHRLQELSVSPALRTLALTGPSAGGAAPSGPPAPIPGGSSVRRLQALIAERRRSAPSGSPLDSSLGAVPEAFAASPSGSTAGLGATSRSGAASGPNPISSFSPAASAVPSPSGSRTLDPFFDDPFA
eukprot:TRINITY_DN14879_c0_g1_i1.p1 TRINITY_DN14879_c0_g1~~TRINITY_DN14879_c0_g1_i1.p1  ORF type:complete len:450 (-),score=69.44 TRINITY_DN14879_c0_g1_i1:144-1418(-)